MIYMYSICFLL